MTSLNFRVFHNHLNLKNILISGNIINKWVEPYNKNNFILNTPVS